MNSQKPRRRPSAAAPGSASTQVIKINGERDKCLDHFPRYVGVRLRQIQGDALDVKIFHLRVFAVTADEVAGTSPAQDLVLDLVLEPPQQIDTFLPVWPGAVVAEPASNLALRFGAVVERELVPEDVENNRVGA